MLLKSRSEIQRFMQANLIIICERVFFFFGKFSKSKRMVIALRDPSKTIFSEPQIRVISSVIIRCYVFFFNRTSLNFLATILDARVPSKFHISRKECVITSHDRRPKLWELCSQADFQITALSSVLYFPLFKVFFCLLLLSAALFLF